MLLVLALVVALFTLAMPALKGPLSRQRLRKAAESVRVAWGKARIEAMRTGSIQAFYYQIGGDGYITTAWYVDDDALESNDRRDAFSPKSASPEFAQPERLLEGITFVENDVLVDARAQSLENAIQAEPLPVGTQDAQWSQPILFYPDGTASDAQLTLTNDRQRIVTVQLRGLTGIARVGDVYTAERPIRQSIQR